MLEQQAAQVGAQAIMGSDHTYVIPGAAGEPKRAGAAARKRSALDPCVAALCQRHPHRPVDRPPIR